MQHHRTPAQILLHTTTTTAAEIGAVREVGTRVEKVTATVIGIETIRTIAAM